MLYSTTHPSPPQIAGNSAAPAAALGRTVSGGNMEAKGAPSTDTRTDPAALSHATHAVAPSRRKPATPHSSAFPLRHAPHVRVKRAEACGGRGCGGTDP